MINAKAHGIQRREGLLRTFFNNDWTHSILANQFAPEGSRNTAMLLIGGEVLASVAMVAWFQGSDVSSYKR